MEGRLEDGNTIILQHVEERCLSCIVKTEEEKLWQSRQCLVIQPALRSHRNILACLFARPSCASMSQTARQVSTILVSIKQLTQTDAGKIRFLTPVARIRLAWGMPSCQYNKGAYHSMIAHMLLASATLRL
jgi:hypothetical protein